MAATLYGIPASHPVYAATLMLRAKGVGYRRIDLPQWFHRPLLRALRFPGSTVPALVLDGRRIQTTGRDRPRARPDPPRAAAAARRPRGTRAGRDDRGLVPTATSSRWAAGSSTGRSCATASAVDSYLEGSRLILPRAMAKPLAPLIIRVVARGHDARDEAIRQDLAALPGVLDRIDGWIADGVLGGSPPNVADYQVATSLALLMAHDDLRPIIAARPPASWPDGSLPASRAGCRRRSHANGSRRPDRHAEQGRERVGLDGTRVDQDDVRDRRPSPVARMAGEGGDHGGAAVVADEHDLIGVGTELGGVVGTPFERLAGGAERARRGGEHDAPGCGSPGRDTGPRPPARRAPARTRAAAAGRRPWPAAT